MLEAVKESSVDNIIIELIQNKIDNKAEKIILWQNN